MKTLFSKSVPFALLPHGSRLQEVRIVEALDLGGTHAYFLGLMVGDLLQSIRLDFYPDLGELVVRSSMGLFEGSLELLAQAAVLLARRDGLKVWSSDPAFREAFVRAGGQLVEVPFERAARAFLAGSMQSIWYLGVEFAPSMRGGFISFSPRAFGEGLEPIVLLDGRTGTLVAVGRTGDGARFAPFRGVQDQLLMLTMYVLAWKVYPDDASASRLPRR